MRVHSAQHVSLRRGRGRSDPYSLVSWVDTLHGKCWQVFAITNCSGPVRDEVKDRIHNQ